MQGNTVSNALEPDNPKVWETKIERIISIQEANRATERGPVCTLFACERVEAGPVGRCHARKLPCCSLTFRNELSGFRPF